MGWTHIPELEYSPASRTDNPWVGHRAQPVGKVSVLLPPEDWLCRKLENLNLVLTEGYPSKPSVWTSFYVHPNPRTGGMESILQNKKTQQDLENL